MKIKNKILNEFIKATSLSGEHALQEVKLDFNDRGLVISAIVEGNSILVRGELPSQSFEEYSELDKVGIINYAELLKVLGTLKEDVTITKEGNVLVFKGGRTVEVPLADESLIKDASKAPNLQYDNTFPMNKSVFDDIEKNITFAMSKNDSATVMFEGSNNIVNVKYGTKYKFTDIVNVEFPSEFKVKFGQPLINAVHNLTGELSVSMKTDFPITIMKKTDTYALKIIVAPKI